MNPVRVAVDIMGGDNAPAAPIEGAVEALKEAPDLHVVLVGRQEIIESELNKHTYDAERITVKNAAEVIETGEHPVQSIRQKKDSSLVVGLNLVRDGEADAVVTAGNTGSVLVGGQTIVKREAGVLRAPIATVIPNSKGISLLLDSGANVDAKPEHLVQFAVMGSAYAEKVMGINNPRVALLNIGEEEDKGNALTKEVYPLLKELQGINFTGNIEARDIPAGAADVIVAEAFAGNCVLKMYEGVASSFLRLIKDAFLSNAKSKVGAALVMPSLKKTLETYNVDNYGGAPLLGLRALVVKTHGNSKPLAFKTALLQSIRFKENELNVLIRDRLADI